MLIRSVTAHAFGPLAGERLEFGDGMTVVHGPNESAKSSWHAAIYAALCGRRRGVGRGSADELEFSRRHRPWGGTQWLVGAELLLDDGRRVELRQDLDGRVDCAAVDLDLGRDISAEIINGGTPDAARWLGLDRISFRATAFVAQTQVLDVLARADGLQDNLQRAASTAAADETASAALQRIVTFQRDAVGNQRAPKRPLRRAIEAVEQAESALARARTEHTGYERRLVDLDQLRSAATVAGQALREGERVEAARAEREAAARAEREAVRAAALAKREAVRAAAVAVGEARQVRQLADDAAAIAAKLPSAPPAAPDPETVSLVAAALAGSPTVTGSPGSSRRQAVTTAVVGESSGMVATGGVVVADRPGASDQELYELARVLDQRPAPFDPEVDERVTRAEAAVTAAVARQRGARTLVLTGVAIVTMAAIVLVLQPPELPSAVVVAAMLVSIVAGLATTIGGGLQLRRAVAAIAQHRHRLAGAELQAATARAASTAVAADYEHACARAVGAGLPTDPSALRDLAHRGAQERAFEVRDQQWHDEARQRLISAAQTVGRPAETAAEAEAGLLAWQRDQAEAAATREAFATGSAKLSALLRGESVAAVRQRATLAAECARTACAAAGLDPSLVDSDRSIVDVEVGVVAPAPGESIVDSAPTVELAPLRAAAAQAGQEAHTAEAALREWSALVLPVGEAEEELARAQAELARLTDLDQTLELTRRFLLQAEETAQRTIAPRLVGAIQHWLPEITGGRYTQVMVDPAGLRVSLRGPSGPWRDAGLLSYGTAEQIYLLLRIALAEQLARPGVSCPLIFDDVTVHADARRTVALLDLLRAASTSRQIIVFTQQEQVADWARQHLTNPSDRLVEVPEVAVV